MILNDKEILKDIDRFKLQADGLIDEVMTLKDNISHLKDNIKSEVLVDLKQYVDSRLLDYKKQMMDEY